MQGLVEGENAIDFEFPSFENSYLMKKLLGLKTTHSLKTTGAHVCLP